MFFDLNLPITTSDALNGDRLAAILEQLIKFEYFGVALNHTVEPKELPKSLDSTKIIPLISKFAPEKQGPLYEQYQFYIKPAPNTWQQTKIRQFRRLTVVIDDATGHLKLSANNPVPAAYDIVAIQPTSEKALSAACRDAEIDIISIDMSGRLPFYFKHTTVGLAVQRGVYFEIAYSPAVRDPNARRNLVANARGLIRATRGKNILISSQAVKMLELRSPYDVVTIASLFGLTAEQARKALGDNAVHILYHAHARKNVYRSVIAEISSETRDATLTVSSDRVTPGKRKVSEI